MQNEAYTTALNIGVLRHVVPGGRPAKTTHFIARNIHRLRLRAKLTREELAELADVDLRSLQRIEAGSWNMTVDYLGRFQVALRCKWRDLVKDLD